MRQKNVAADPWSAKKRKVDSGKRKDKCHSCESRNPEEKNEK